jgi:TonB family protein
MEDIFKEGQPRSAKQWIVEHQVGLLSTVVFHLVLLLVVLILKLNPVPPTETMVALELVSPSQLEKAEQNKPQEPPVKSSEAQLPSSTPASKASEVRNVAVNSNLNKLTDKLVDDKFGKSNPVYEEARRLEERMRANQQLYKKSLEADKQNNQEAGQGSASSRSSSEKAYRGASVLSYSLEGRQGVSLPVPAYLCEGGGDVVVDIVVNTRGQVVSASISARSTASECLFAEAVRAAKRSRFTIDEKAPSSQRGSITYRFVAQ